jgi:histone deacetylase 1/2
MNLSGTAMTLSDCLTLFRCRTLEEIKYELLQQLQNLQGAPSVQMQQVPPLYEVRREVEDNPDERPSAKTRNGDGDNKVHESELYDQID